MGLRIDMSEINEQIKSIDAILKQKNEANKQLKATFSKLHQIDSLKGKTYENMRNHFINIHIPIIDGLIAANDAIIDANQVFKEQFAVQVDSSPSAKIDADNIQSLVTQMNSLSNYLNEAQSTNQNYIAVSQNRLMRTQEVIEQIQKLHDFDSSCAQLYDLSNQLLEHVSTGISYLNSGSYDNSTHSFVPAVDASINWLNKLNKLNVVSKAEIDAIAKKVPHLSERDISRLDAYIGQNPGNQIPEPIMKYLKDNKDSILADTGNELLLFTIEQSGKLAGAKTLDPGAISFGKSLGKVAKYGGYASTAVGIGIGTWQDVNDGKTIGQGIAHGTFTAGAGLGGAGLTLVAFSNPGGWVASLAVGVGVAVSYGADWVYQNNFLKIQDGVDYVGNKLDDFGQAVVESADKLVITGPMWKGR
ncbi:MULTISPECIES: T7SS effector LXG polymorphic toxin [Listeria]|uniref:T7SS effector LXG polymorphic toxin n=1 Tax=Listeria TaxID=1637 RepID=UPI000B58BAE6|nr:MULTISPECIES: T7SS effector LXG polymorphic toxin [Listeria]